MTSKMQIVALLLFVSSVGFAHAQPNFSFTYQESGSDVILTMKTVTTSDEWLSVGFNDTGKMVNSDVIVCETGSNTRCTDRRCTALAECPIDAEQNISTTTTTANGITTFTVKRPMQTSDSTDYVIKAGTAPTMTWAYGTGATSRQHSRNGSFKPSLTTTTTPNPTPSPSSSSALSVTVSLKVVGTLCAVFAYMIIF